MPIIEVKNLKYAEFASEETHCFNATIYVDGVRFCHAANDGHGGCDHYTELKGDKPARQLYTEIAAIDAAIKKARPDEFETHTRKDKSTFEIGPDFESGVSDAVATSLYIRDMKNALRRNWMFVKGPNAVKGIYQYSKAKGDDAAEWANRIKAKYPEAIILNAIPEGEALKLWRAQG